MCKNIDLMNWTQLVRGKPHFYLPWVLLDYMHPKHLLQPSVPITANFDPLRFIDIV